MRKKVGMEFSNGRKRVVIMQTQPVHLDALLLGGVGFYGDPFSKKSGWDSENEIGRTWNRFMAHLAANPERAYSCKKSCLYEVHIYGDETASKGCFEIFVGEEVNTAQLPVPLCAKFFPASDYIKVTLAGTEIISDWWQELETEILPKYRVKRSDCYMLQVYDERFLGMDQLEGSVLDVLVAVQK